MSHPSAHNKILIIDSGGGYGGPGAFLLYFLRYLDKDKFQPFVAFCYFHVSPETNAVQQMGVPTFFLSSSRSLENYLQVKFLPAQSKWRWLHLGRMAVHFFLHLILVDLPRLWNLLKLLKNNHIDLILLNNDVHYHLVGTLAARIRGIPCICRKAGGIGEGRLFKKILTPWVDLFIAISAATSKDQVENNPATKRVVSIFEGVDLERFVPSSLHPGLRKELGIPKSKKIVACVSRLIEGKGHRELIEAATSIVKNYKDVVFLLVGDGANGMSGPFVKSLKNRIQELGLAHHFIFARWRTDIPEVLSLVDLFVHCPTTWIEGLGIAHLEAMAMGKPTVVSHNGGLPDAALDGVTGFVVPPGDVGRLSSAILKLLNDNELSLRMGRNARQRVEELFDMRKNTKQMELLLQEYSLKNQHGSQARPDVRQRSLDGSLHETVK